MHLFRAPQILLIRPKLHLANDGNYREPRYFATWKQPRTLEAHTLPALVADATATAAGGAAAGGSTRQTSCPFGDGILAFNDALLAAETCEELFTPLAPHIALALAGVEIISNGSGSHHQLRKLDTRLDLIRGATGKYGVACCGRSDVQHGLGSQDLTCTGGTRAPLALWRHSLCASGHVQANSIP